MIDKKKIVAMTNMAIYDKEFGEKDRKIASYFRHDYVYKKNMILRVNVFIGCLVLLILNIIYRVSIEGMDLAVLDFKQLGINAVTFVLIIMLIYSLIGTIIYTNEYAKVMSRLDKYDRIIDSLERSKVQKKSEEEVDSDF